VADASDKPHDDDERAIALLRNQPAPVFLALNKTDLIDESTRAARRAQNFSV